MNQKLNKLLDDLMLLHEYWLRWFLSIGIICHEFWHYVIAKLFQVEIKTFEPFIFRAMNEIFDENKFTPIRGRVSYTNKSILNMSSLAAFCISIAPMLSLVVIFLMYKFNILFIREYLWLLIPILLTSFPSVGDFKCYNFHLRKNNTKRIEAKISWFIFLLCTLIGNLLEKISHHLSVLIVIVILLPVDKNLINIVWIFYLYIIIYFILNWLVRTFKIKSKFFRLSINEYFSQTFYSCKSLSLLRLIFTFPIKTDSIVSQILGLNIKINLDTLETFLKIFPQASEVESRSRSCTIFTTDIKLDSLPSKYGLFIFNKEDKKLEQFSIYFNEDYSHNTLNIILEKWFNITKPYLLKLKEEIFNTPVTFCKKMPPLSYQLDGKYLELYNSSSQELVLSYSSFWYVNILPLVELKIETTESISALKRQNELRI